MNKSRLYNYAISGICGKKKVFGHSCTCTVVVKSLTHFNTLWLNESNTGDWNLSLIIDNAYQTK